MVKHDILVRGVNLSGITQDKPDLLQMNNEDFPKAFLRDLSAMGQPAISSTQSLPSAPSLPATLYQPVQRVAHLALVQLACDTLGEPRLDPRRIESAGLVIRRVYRLQGVDQLSAPPWAWYKSADGMFRWAQIPASYEDDDPDPSRRPLLRSGQPALDELLAEQSLSHAMTEVSTPAFVAAPEVCAAAQRTFAYALIPTASSDLSSQKPSAPQYDNQTLASGLPTLLKAGPRGAPHADQTVDYRYMTDDYAKANNAKDFLTFSTALRMMYSVFGAFEETSEARNLLAVLNDHNVTIASGSGFTQQPMGHFYRHAATVLIDYDPNAEASQPAPILLMPHAWDVLSDQDQGRILAAISNALQARSVQVLAPQGRFQDATRLYRLRIFFRVKSEHPECPPGLVWSCYSDPFRIAAWYEGPGRPLAPVPLPDPTDRNFLKNAKPNASFAVPAGLMNAMQGTTLAGLSSGTGGGGGIDLNWICGFSIPLITICAFFVLNIFLTLLNIVFFWMAFIKICIPFPVPAPGSKAGSDA